MKSVTGSTPRWMPLIGTAKIAWGELTDNPWLQLEGRRLKFDTQMKENTAFAQLRVLTGSPRTPASLQAAWLSPVNRHQHAGELP